MDLKKYYEKIIDEIKSFNFKIIEITEPAPEKISPHLEALNYFLYEYNLENKDTRDLELEYIIIPETKFNFSKIKFDDFFNFIRKVKTDDSLLIDIKDIKIKKEIEKIEDDFWDKPIKEKKKITKKLKVESSVDDFWK